MNPLSTRPADGSTLQDLGRASIQIVHDLKNQLNGLKLYATFLRRRIEKAERPEDEQQTIAKLIAGLDRAASDLSTIVQYGREIELKQQPGCDIQKVLRSICSQLNESVSLVNCETGTEPILGSFDPTKITDALNWITVGAIKHRQSDDQNRVVTITVGHARDHEDRVLIEWSGLATIDHDPFRSFAGSDEIRMSLAAKIVEAHHGSTEIDNNRFIVTLPLTNDAVEKGVE